MGENAIQAIAAELLRSRELHGPMASAHEGYAVLLEEMDELWDEVKRGGDKPRSMERMRKEALQVAAMGARFLVDICGMDGAVGSEDD